MYTAGMYPVLEYMLPIQACSLRDVKIADSVLAVITNDPNDKTHLGADSAAFFGHDKNKPDESICILLRRWDLKEQKVLLIKNKDIVIAQFDDGYIRIVLTPDQFKMSVKTNPDMLRAEARGCFPV